MHKTGENAGQPLNGKRCLVVEDEFLIAIDIEGILQSAGAEEVLCASSAEEALRLITTEPIDFAVLDLKLANRTSLDAADALSEKAVPFVFVTGAPDDIGKLSRHRDTPVLAKPFEIKSLLDLLGRIFADK